MNASWTIEPIPLYRFCSPGPEVLFQRAFSEMIDMVIYSFLLRNGRSTIVVDTGLPKEHSALNRSVISRKGPGAGFFPIGNGFSAELVARNVGVDLVIVTSFGPYAVGGLEALEDRPVFVSARGVADLNQAEEPALVHPVADHLRSALLRGQTVRGESEVTSGVTFVETGIHHPASAAVIVSTGDGTIAIADPVFTARNLTEGLALGAAEDAAGWHSMVRMLGQRCDAILPIHDVSPTPVRREAWHPSI